MTRRGMRTLWAVAVAMLVAGWGATAWAQNGTLMGKVVDIKGRDIPEIQLTIDFKGEPAKQFKAITDKYGEWYKSGIPPGTWVITARKEWVDRTDKTQAAKTVTISGSVEVTLNPGQKLRAPDIGAITAEDRAAGKGAPVRSSLSTAEAEAANKRAAEMESLLKDANADIEAGNHADAITKLTSLAEKLAADKRPCAECYAKIGEVQLKLKADDKAEAAFLKAIEMNPNLAPPYLQLATIYNAQRKFDEAKNMTDKAAALTGAGGGGGDANSAYNRGIINWNAGQYEEAKGDFAKAAQIDPKMANAHYYLGMTIFNLASSGKGTMADAKTPFQEYLKLAPTGEYAEVAKAILATIK